jgi:phenylpyruvate tautomerase PptA (4-oxalocrotonate tautomerase family)
MHAKPRSEPSSAPTDDKAPSRRAILLTGAAGVVAGAAATDAAALADTPAPSFGAPVVELTVPAGALTSEQKAAMIKGITNVLDGALKQPPDLSRRMFVEIIETAEGGFGVNGQVFIPPKR